MSTIQELRTRVNELECQNLGLMVTLHRFANVGSRRRVCWLHVSLVRHLSKEDPDYLFNSAHHDYDRDGRMIVGEDELVFGTTPTSFREMQAYLKSDAFREKWKDLTKVFAQDQMDRFLEDHVNNWEGKTLTQKWWEDDDWNLEFNLCWEQQQLRTVTTWATS